MNRQLEDTLAGIATAQYGVVTLRQAVAAGLTRCMVERRLASGRFRLLHRGVYLVLPFALPHTRAMAAVLASGESASLSHLTALALWKLCRASEVVDVAVKNHRGRRPGIRPHRLDLRDDECTVHEGIPVTTPPRTLLDVASVFGFRELENAIARAEREGLVTPEALFQLLTRHPGHPGTRLLRTVLTQVGGPVLTRSEAEELFLALVAEAALPRPECNVAIGPYELDFLWRAAALGVEVDGFRHHASRQSFEGDRRKDAWLLAAGITVLRVTWRQITDKRLATAILLDRALGRR